MSHAGIRDGLRDRLGLDPESIGGVTLDHAIEETMRRLGLATAAGLLERIQLDPEAWQVLLEEVTVPETWFFRVPEQYTELASCARTRRSRGLFRVLSLPCSTGEEAWSAAWTLADAGLALSEFEVVGIDVNARAVATARRARYRRAAFRAAEPPPGFGAEIAGEWQPPAALAQRVSFRVGNALDPTLLADTGRFDAIFCRNLLIYLDLPARRRVLDRIDALLAEDGLVFAGQAEALPALDPRWQGAEDLGPLTFRRAGRTEPASASSAPMPASAPQRSERRPRPPSQPLPIPHSSLDEAQRLADAGALGPAESLLNEWLADRPEDATAWRLLGTVCLARDQLSAADDALARAGYLDRGDQESLRLRILIAERQGQAEAAARLRARLARGEGVRT
jgi:chemotaxis protein methyltransferase WspC